MRLGGVVAALVLMRRYAANPEMITSKQWMWSHHIRPFKVVISCPPAAPRLEARMPSKAGDVHSKG